MKAHTRGWPIPTARLFARFFRATVIVVLLCPLGEAFGDTVRVVEQDVIIPTYLAGEPDPNPMFHFGRNSQGAEGRVYPYPLYDTLTNVKSNKSYRVIYLENEYVRVGILPEIGGRLFEAVDKSNGYNFVYRQHVIKPALIGLIGAWISGGIEWNIPHHHRATTFLPVQYRVSANADGSRTVWVGELEIRHRMRWAVGYTLHPGKSYLECSVRILNRTPVANTMLCFANVAVHVNENYQVIYPPSTRFVTFHGKHEFTTWPIATTRYAGADFTRGVDVSWYTNHASANSMFAWNYEDDFFAGYDHGRNAGTMSVADHGIIPGKKFWTWGNGPRGRMWDKILTDDDGPYIELMVGAYSDNQPDYSWLQPYETKSFHMYWYPFRAIGGVKNANLDAAVNLEATTNRLVKLGFCTTAAHRSAKILLKAKDKILFSQNVAISPAKPFVRDLSLPTGVSEYDLQAALLVDGKELLAYSPSRLGASKMPEPVKDPPPPDQVKTVEELYLAGQRIEQFHSPNQQPEPYWDEALRRDPGDARVHLALGIRQLKEARFADAEQHFRKAIERLSFNYTSPKDGEAFYYLGLALQCLSWSDGLDQTASITAAKSVDDRSRRATMTMPAGANEKLDAAAAAFEKATWSQAWRSPAGLALAEIAARRGDFVSGLRHVQDAVEANALNVRALTLNAALLRHLGRTQEAHKLMAGAMVQTDPLDVRIVAERWLSGENGSAAELAVVLREHPATALETAAEYLNAGLYQEGEAFLKFAVRSATSHTKVSPLLYYYLAEFAELAGNSGEASNYRQLAQGSSPEYVFPFQWELIPILRRAMDANPNDARAPYYLGNLLFDWQPAVAASLWETSAKLDPSFPLAHRNLALVLANRKPAPDLNQAVAELERAVSAQTKYAEHFAELDRLYAESGAAPEKRLGLLESNHHVVAKRDDALSREIGLKVFAGKYNDAIGLMTGRKFSVWEGGSLDVADHWVDAHLLRGQKELKAGQMAAALADFESAEHLPDNLPTEQELGRDAEIDYWLGVCQNALAEPEKARLAWTASAGIASANTARPGRKRVSMRQSQSYFAAESLLKLGRTSEAENTFRKLLEGAREALEQVEAERPSGGGQTENPTTRAKAAAAHYLAGLAHLGLGEKEVARTEFEEALRAAPDCLGARSGLAQIR